MEHIIILFSIFFMSILVHFIKIDFSTSYFSCVKIMRISHMQKNGNASPKGKFKPYRVTDLKSVLSEARLSAPLELVVPPACPRRQLIILKVGFSVSVQL